MWRLGSSTLLPSGNIYGLGERSGSLKVDLDGKKIVMFASGFLLSDISGTRMVTINKILRVYVCVFCNFGHDLDIIAGSGIYKCKYVFAFFSKV